MDIYIIIGRKSSELNDSWGVIVFLWYNWNKILKKKIKFELVIKSYEMYCYKYYRWIIVYCMF